MCTADCRGGYTSSPGQPDPTQSCTPEPWAHRQPAALTSRQSPAMTPERTLTQLASTPCLTAEGTSVMLNLPPHSSLTQSSDLQAIHSPFNTDSGSSGPCLIPVVPSLTQPQVSRNQLTTFAPEEKTDSGERAKIRDPQKLDKTPEISSLLPFQENIARNKYSYLFWSQVLCSYLPPFGTAISWCYISLCLLAFQLDISVV